ncbi:hypothetical protein SH528x_001078 [Novipirellula sp. SH528]|uniref:hypothetical protein n=1 Tax=Novipirellula sp. SH528 TaxID=3454466 RepID=UPI003FA05F07
MKSFRFTISTMLQLVAVAALSVALVQSRMHVSSLENEINSLSPLRELDIAAQVEKATAGIGVPATVHLTAHDRVHRSDHYSRYQQDSAKSQR